MIMLIDVTRMTIIIILNSASCIAEYDSCNFARPNRYLTHVHGLQLHSKHSNFLQAKQRGRLYQNICHDKGQGSFAR